VPTAEAGTPRPPTVPPAPAGAHCAHTRTPNAVEKTAEHATVRLETASAKQDGPEARAPAETAKSELLRTTDPVAMPTATPLALPPTNHNAATNKAETAKAATAAHCAHTRTPSAVAMTVEHATATPVRASARTGGPAVPAPLATAALATSPMAPGR